jgi:photosystem II stability/assembly factor-like uncharacterized protein
MNMASRVLLKRRQILAQAACGALLAGARWPAAFAADGSAGAAPNGSNAAPYAWQSVVYGAGGFIDGFVFHPREKGLLYARTDIGGAYRFDPATSSWVPLLDHLSKADGDLMGVLSVALDPRDPERVYLACGLYLGKENRDGAVLASNDRGRTWRVTELGMKIGGNSPGRGTGERLAVDPNQGDIVWLGTSQDGLVGSRDGGRSFHPLDFPAKHVSLVLFDPTSGTLGQPSQTVVIGSHDQPGLWITRNAGHTFERVAETPALTPQRAVFAADGSLYVTFAGGPDARATNPGNATSGGVWKRDTRGHWTDISPVRPAAGEDGFGWSGIDLDRQVPGRLVVSSLERWKPGDDLFVSSDDGAHWTPVGAHSKHDPSAYPWLVNYMKGQDRMGHWLADVKLDPFDGDRAIYGTGYGLWMTRDLGAAQHGGTVHWDFTVANFEETATLEIKSPSGGATLLAAMGDVSGGAWDDLTKTPRNGLFAPSNETNRSVDFAGLAPGIIARTSDHCATGGYWSNDGAVTWHAFGESSRKKKTEQGWTAPTGTVAVSAKGTSFLWVPEKQAALCSHDHGKTWVESTGWPVERDIPLMPVADRTIDGVFYVHDRVNGQVLVSVDGGRSFQPGVTGLSKVEFWQTSQMICAPGTVRDLWLALPDMLLHLPGLDRPAKPARHVEEAWQVALGKGPNGASYHSVFVWGRVSIGFGDAEPGLFRSDDGGQNWVRIDDERHRFGRLLSIAGDPLEHGTVYLAAHGRGVLVGRPRSAG